MGSIGETTGSAVAFAGALKAEACGTDPGLDGCTLLGTVSTVGG